MKKIYIYYIVSIFLLITNLEAQEKFYKNLSSIVKFIQNDTNSSVFFLNNSYQKLCFEVFSETNFHSLQLIPLKKLLEKNMLIFDDSCNTLIKKYNTLLIMEEERQKNHVKQFINLNLLNLICTDSDYLLVFDIIRDNLYYATIEVVNINSKNFRKFIEYLFLFENDKIISFIRITGDY
jgi:hypothetical protein